MSAGGGGGPLSELFVTGYLRSGTSLLEKLLHGHEQVCVGAQPFPLLLVGAAEAFHVEIGYRPPHYQLSHRFLEGAYPREAFDDFLRRRVFSREEIRRLFERMQGYSGWHTPELGPHAGEAAPGTFVDLYRALVGCLPAIHRKPRASVLGAKEVLGEDFVPVLLESGVRVVLVLRDVRDVLASIKFPSERAFVAPTLPTLNVLRMWRKSVAFALAHEGHPGLRIVRYEDLVGDASGVLGSLFDWLGLPREGSFAGAGLRDQRGARWPGNSSFGERDGVDASSVESFRRLLPESCRRYVETLAGPELVALRYAAPQDLSRADVDALCAFREPGAQGASNAAAHPRFASDYSVDRDRIEAELRRLELLDTGDTVDDEEEWFLYPGARERLGRSG